jgi:F0F1-type ATP synthase membrane subunit c/vacuolar-type H+-ATPase subunit K
MAKKKATSENKVKMIAIAVAVGLVLTAAGFGSGYLVGARGVGEVEREGAAAVQEVTGRLASTETRLDGELDDLRRETTAQREELQARLEQQQRRLAMLEGRRLLGLVLLSLDDRNFGTAQERLGAAIAQLERGVGDDEGRRAFLEELRESEVVVAGNLQVQRGRFRELVDQLDRLLGEGAQEAREEN